MRNLPTLACLFKVERRKSLTGDCTFVSRLDFFGTMVLLVLDSSVYDCSIHALGP